MRTAIAALAALTLAAPAAAQEETIPSGLVAYELERSRTCVDVLARLADLDEQLAPLAERSQRLLAIAEAVALEDERVMEELDRGDPTELEVHEWFTRDRELAQRYVATLAEELTEERAAAREAIKVVITDALAAVQSEANAAIEASDNLPQRASPCDGAIFVRSAVLEACPGVEAVICEQAALPASEVIGFRFVDAPEAVWDVQELRPWTEPTPIGIGPDGQLDGARTIGYSRTGNVVVTVAFSPLIQDRAELTPEGLQRFETTNDSLGIVFDHPELALTPALGLRATLPRPLADESAYVLHFGPPEEADVVWTGPAGTGEPVQATVPLGASHVGRLRSGDALSLTAIRSGPDDGEAVFAVELASVNQSRATQALFGYMTEQLGRDLTALLTPRGAP